MAPIRDGRLHEFAHLRREWGRAFAAHPPANPHVPRTLWRDTRLQGRQSVGIR